MAINFSASFAACLAAGLKVPRQIMYCISQGTAALLFGGTIARTASPAIGTHTSADLPSSGAPFVFLFLREKRRNEQKEFANLTPLRDAVCRLPRS
ncbi:hypothetical protein Zmor_006581 [Zophobas morio]|uniref:Uncharacterized protein n=1 Tax=Zophobas morio TaxID=2755281 RepID=A0AA38MLI4_9CUCU|nr:hypothetical protein Zmor_006581 [Zophobas morio]